MADEIQTEEAGPTMDERVELAEEQEYVKGAIAEKLGELETLLHHARHVGMLIELRETATETIGDPIPLQHLYINRVFAHVGFRKRKDGAK